MPRVRTRILIPPPSTVNTPYERYFPKDAATLKWNLAGYDPNFIQNKVTYEEVETLLMKLDAIPAPKAPCIGWACCLLCGGLCVLNSFAKKVREWKQQLTKVLQDENTRLGMRGVHWDWAGGSNAYHTIPCLHLDFNKAAMV